MQKIRCISNKRKVVLTNLGREPRVAADNAPARDMEEKFIEPGE
jgi:hypothetical protein